jgi:enoyl-CoA hydratase/carnithine racemase
MAQIKLTRSSPRYWRVTFDNPPLNLMGPEFVLEFREIITALETDEELRVVVFDSAVEGFFLNHSDFNAKLKDLTDIPQGPTGLEAWPDILVRLTHAPVVSIALIRGLHARTYSQDATMTAAGLASSSNIFRAAARQPEGGRQPSP